ncbi:MAG TPA: hypothetical protein VFE96_02950, partial [Candidatus Bathyarchaeia archaeon]|nr:hypothetical protein [Candidatus Bathyarchaeia archaeon]
QTQRSKLETLLDSDPSIASEWIPLNGVARHPCFENVVRRFWITGRLASPFSAFVGRGPRALHGAARTV